MTKEELTKSQQKLYDQVVKYRNKYGVMPTYADMAKALNCSAQNVLKTTKIIDRKGHWKHDNRRRKPMPITLK